MNQVMYHYLILAQKDLLENQCIEELLRERTGYYSMRKKQRDFWMTLSPNFIYLPSVLTQVKESQFYKQKKEILSSHLFEKSDQNHFFASLISLDKEFINWLHLRLRYFENIEKERLKKNKKEKNFVSDGLQGSFSLPSQVNPLKGYANYINPYLLLKKNTKFLELYYKTFTKKQMVLS
jgi:hypothetical protein